MKAYAKAIYDTRYFWFHLARSDLRNRFRRSKLGILWSMMTPLLLTIIMATVFGTVFGLPLGDFAPYVLSGLIVWDIIVSSFVGGSNAIISSEQYIRQANHPLTIYSLKWAIVTITTFMIATISLVLWMLIASPQNILMGIVTLPVTVVILLFLSWSITTFSSHINAKYRDFPQVIALLVQILWFFSPVFFQQEMFMSNPVLEMVFMYNPITHVLALVREPFLFGQLPTAQNYAFAIGFTLAWAGIAIITHKRMRSDIIFYI